jgi:hypothetical protein
MGEGKNIRVKNIENFQVNLSKAVYTSAIPNETLVDYQHIL